MAADQRAGIVLDVRLWMQSAPTTSRLGERLHRPLASQRGTLQESAGPDCADGKS